MGNGDIILNQTPLPNSIISRKNSSVILYTVQSDDIITVPKLVGLSLNEASVIAINYGFNLMIEGNGGTVTEQSLPLGAMVKRGSVIKIKTLNFDHED